MVLVDISVLLGFILFNQLLAGGGSLQQKGRFQLLHQRNRQNWETDKTGKSRATFKDRAIHTIPTKNNALVAKIIFASFNSQDEKQSTNCEFEETSTIIDH